jgi:hypothetical protein
VTKAQNNSRSSEKKSPRQEAFEREAREKLEHADMDMFDKMMKRVIQSKKTPIGSDRK